jgi:hypothetical protein
VADAVVELRISDQEPLASFLAGTGEALEQFGKLSDTDMAVLPEPARCGIDVLYEAFGDLAEGRHRPRRKPDEDGFRGAVIIEWPHSAKRGVGALRGCLVAVYDALTGDEPEPKMISTVTCITIHAPANGLVIADLTMFADGDGNPVYDGMPVIQDGETVMATFPFIVAEMRVRYS